MQPFGNIKQIVHVGADALMLYFKGSSIDDANNTCLQWLSALDACVAKKDVSWQWLVETIPSYDSLLIVFNVEKIDSHGVYTALSQLAAHSDFAAKPGMQTASSTQKVIPVWYGAPSANDLRAVSNKTSLPIDEVIRLHTSTEYKVYAVGFSPGFAYMGDIPEALQCARLDTPRKRVPKGAVAIADRQTAVYPNVSPGGWNLLGLTPLALITHKSGTSTPFLRAGDKVRFKAISEEEFKRYHES